jgi:hypothetical protein
LGGKYKHGPGASRRGDAKLRLMMMSAPHTGHADLLHKDAPANELSISAI